MFNTVLYRGNIIEVLTPKYVCVELVKLNGRTRQAEESEPETLVDPQPHEA